MIVESGSDQWMYYHVQETSLRQFELCGITLMEVVIRRCGHGGMDKASHITQEDSVELKMLRWLQGVLNCPKKALPTTLNHHLEDQKFSSSGNIF